MPAAASAKSFEAQCGPARFRVNVENKGHPLDNSYELVAVTTSGNKRLFVAEEGGWLHAACVRNAKGQPMLLFQSYCGGSKCVEDKYGIVDPTSLNVLLKPSAKNVGNAKEASKLLGKSVPYLPKYKEAFCCEN
jgi:hypothetical protein